MLFRKGSFEKFQRKGMGSVTFISGFSTWFTGSGPEPKLKELVLWRLSLPQCFNLMLKLLLVLLLLPITAFSRPSISKLGSSPISVAMSTAPAVKSAGKPAAIVIPDAVKLIFGAGGIYAAFLYYGNTTNYFILVDFNL